MKLFFASDIHGSLPATQRMLSLFEQSQASHLILLGDFLNHGPRNPIPDGYNPAEVAKLLNQHKAHIIAVRGNCDSEVDQMLLEFPVLASFSQVLLSSGQRLFLTHGHIYHQDNWPPIAPGDVLVHGHTHIPLAEMSHDGFVFNPGSITFPKGGFAPSFGLYDSEPATLRVIDFNSEATLLSLVLE